MNINLEYYKIFYYVGKYESITQASKELAISQPAVSQAVKNLEAGIGTALFIRTSKGVRLSTEGKLLYEYIEKGYSYIKLGEQKLAESLNLEAGEIKIGASDMTLQFYLLPYLEEFHEKYPGIKVTVTNAPTPETLKYMHTGKIDFGVISTPFEKKEGIQDIQVKEIQDIFIAGSKFSDLKDRPVKYEELELLPIICLEKNTSSRKYIDTFLDHNKVTLSPEFELATSDMIVQFVLRNFGVGCVVKEFAQKYLDSGEIFALNFEQNIPPRNFSIVKNRKVPVSAAAERLLAMLS